MFGRSYLLVALLIFADVIMKASCKQKGSLTFLVDDTLSMKNDIKQVKSSIHQILDSVSSEKASKISNMVLVTFNDPDAKVRIVTKNREDFNKALAAVRLHSYENPDCREYSMTGLILALKTSDRGSNIIVFTDATAKDAQNVKIVKELCKKRKTQVSFVVTGRCTKAYPDKLTRAYYSIAQACSGFTYEVDKDEIAKTHGDIIENIVSGDKTVISEKNVPDNVVENIAFDINESVKHVIVSATGKNVMLKVSGPVDKQKKLVWNDVAKVVKLYNVKPGRYTATVQSESKTSVHIEGWSDSESDSPEDTPYQW